jgi:hypothetical protein
MSRTASLYFTNCVENVNNCVNLQRRIMSPLKVETLHREFFFNLTEPASALTGLGIRQEEDRKGTTVELSKPIR